MGILFVENPWIRRLGIGSYCIVLLAFFLSHDSSTGAALRLYLFGAAHLAPIVVLAICVRFDGLEFGTGRRALYFDVSENTQRRVFRLQTVLGSLVFLPGSYLANVKFATHFSETMGVYWPLVFWVLSVMFLVDLSMIIIQNWSQGSE